jgi:hypothetical protein
VNENTAFEVVRDAIKRARPELAESIQGREELDKMTLEIMTAINEAGLQVTTQQNEAGETDQN